MAVWIPAGEYAGLERLMFPWFVKVFRVDCYFIGLFGGVFDFDAVYCPLPPVSVALYEINIDLPRF